MKSFHDYTVIKESILLNESLDSAAEFYMTDDTSLPDHVYTKFTVEEDTYSVVFSKSNVAQVYIVSVGRCPGKYLKLWQTKPNHIRQVLATTIKVIEAVTPLLGTKALGFAFRLPALTKRDLIPLMNKMINRSYIKTLKAIPVDNSTVEWPYIFIARKTADVKTLFKGKDFNKYDFSKPVSLTQPQPAPTAAPEKPAEEKDPIADTENKKQVFSADATYQLWLDTYNHPTKKWVAAKLRYYYSVDMTTSHFLNVMKKHKDKFSGDAKFWILNFISDSQEAQDNSFAILKMLKMEAEKVKPKGDHTSGFGAKATPTNLTSIPGEALQNELKPTLPIKPVVTDKPSTKWSYSTGAAKSIDLADTLTNLTPEDVVEKKYNVKEKTTGDAPKETFLNIDDFQKTLAVKQVVATGPVMKKVKKSFSEMSKEKYDNWNNDTNGLANKTAAMISTAIQKNHYYNTAKGWVKYIDEGKLYKPSWMEQSQWDSQISLFKAAVAAGKVSNESIKKSVAIAQNWLTNPEDKEVEHTSSYHISDYYSKPKANQAMKQFTGWIYSVTNDDDDMLMHVYDSTFEGLLNSPTLEDQVMTLANGEYYVASSHTDTKLKAKNIFNSMTPDERHKKFMALLPKYEEYKKNFALLPKPHDPYGHGYDKSYDKAVVKEIDLGIQDFDYKFPGNADLTGEKVLDYKYSGMPYQENMTSLRNFFKKSVNLLSHDMSNAVKSYTGSGYNSMNDELRNALKTGSAYTPGQLMTKSVSMAKAWDLIEGLPYDQLVYRSTAIPTFSPEWDINENIIDAGFLSTTIHAGLNFGGHKTILAITLPKGSKVIVTGDTMSHNDGEYELILPAFSVLKPYKIVRGPARQVIYCVYVGNGQKSFFEKIKAKTLKEGFTISKKTAIHESLLNKVLENLKVGVSKSKFEDSPFASVEDLHMASLAVKKGDIKISLNDLKKKQK